MSPTLARARVAYLMLAAVCLASCGGGGSATPSTSSPAIAPAILALTPCAPSGVTGATDYQVGDGQAYTELEQVPWENLRAGDTVRIHHRATAYKGKFMLSAQGTAIAPVRVCGIRNASNQRPTIDGSGATTRPALETLYGSTTVTAGRTVREIHQSRSIVVFKQTTAQSSSAYPQHIQLDGLHFTRAHPSYSYTDGGGVVRSYDQFGACIWVERGHNITIADNEISDCQMAIFSKSTDDGLFARTHDLRVAGNYFHGNGVVGSFLEHTTYLQSVNLVVELNHYGPMRSGAGGNQHKDRSVGSVIRYNRIEGGAHNLDLVEAEDFYVYATGAGATDYRRAFVYGNLLNIGSGSRAVVHYGGDHFTSVPGDNWGEGIFRKGTLYFFHNTVQASANARLFRISTTEETVEAWNNVFVANAGTLSLRERENDPIGAAWTPDGVLNLGRNWISSGWSLGNAALQGSVSGTANLLTGASSPISASTWSPLAGGNVIVDNAAATPTAASGHPVTRHFDTSLVPVARPVNGTAADLGAVER
ncbi:hypothetical protein [Sphaerotilus mobilis]|uniref:hypothetical protein n=1 Tax=Sphaerotilus mobilis TaxID=47994 RepID=UPI00102CB885|nr:hypothetical protein [Sphaerotilus mobilis]